MVALRVVLLLSLAVVCASAAVSKKRENSVDELKELERSLQQLLGKKSEKAQPAAKRTLSPQEKAKRGKERANFLKARSSVKKATEAVEKKRSMMAGKEDAKEKKSESSRREMARAMHEMDAKRAQNLRKLADKADKKLAAYCDDGTSIPESWVCDYITDCSCGEDEDNCGPVDDGDFYCYDGYTIPYSWVCDGMWDCMSGEDEMCGDDDSYWCDDGTEIPADWECDGISDCMYGEDEWYCMDYGGSGDGHDPYYYYYIRGQEDKKTDQSSQVQAEVPLLELDAVTRRRLVDFGGTTPSDPDLLTSMTIDLQVFPVPRPPVRYHNGPPPPPCDETDRKWYPRSRVPPPPYPAFKLHNMAAKRFSYSVGMLFALVTSLIEFGTGFNIDVDTRSAIVRRGPYGSYFGFSVDLHREGDKTWMLVGAPRAQTRQPGTDHPGAAYMCNLDHEPCVQIPFDTTGSDLIDGSLTLYKEDKSFQWFGASIKSSGPNGPVVACAPWYVYYTKYVREREPIGSCFVARRNFTSFREYTPCHSADEYDIAPWHRTGFCQAGFSVTFTSDGSKILIGAVGSYNWQGQVYSQSVRRSLMRRTSIGPAKENDTYLGYSTAVGEFDGDSLEDEYVVGVPRAKMMHGAVVILDATMRELATLAGEQMGAYFGYSVCVQDVNGDGVRHVVGLNWNRWERTSGYSMCVQDVNGEAIDHCRRRACGSADVDRQGVARERLGAEEDDVLVGAPMWTDREWPDSGWERGRVYIFHQLRAYGSRVRFNIAPTLIGEGAGERFGLSMVGLGDISKDGYNDVAISAPYGGKESAGVVYIYNGSPYGLKTEYSQKISGEAVVPGIRTFGFSLSASADIDGNQYRDLIVGAHATDTAVVLRTRPILRVHSTVTVEPKVIDLENKVCQMRDGTAPCSRNGPVYSWNVTSETRGRSSGSYVPDNLCRPPSLFRIELQYETVLDRIRASNSRADFLGRTDAIKLIRLTQGVRKCEQSQAYIRPDLRDKLTPIEVAVTHSLDDRPGAVLPPILDHHARHTVTDQTNILKDCGKDNICDTDLRITVSSERKDILIGTPYDFIMHAEVRNAGEGAYEAVMTMDVPDEVDYIGFHKKSK
ncbi:hypothetical protein Bbelb_063060, partial [Branchiostoma belcheri]